MSLQRVRINNISDFVSQLNSGGGNNSSEENSSAEYPGTGLRISSTARPVAKSSGQDDTDAENPHTPGTVKHSAWSAEQSSLWESWLSPSDSLWSGTGGWKSVAETSVLRWKLSRIEFLQVCLQGIRRSCRTSETHYNGSCSR